MTIKEYTQKLDHLRWLIESKKEKILGLEATATDTAAKLTGMPHNPTAASSRIAEAVQQKIDLENSIKADEAEMRALKKTMNSAIEQIASPKLQVILYKRYIRCMKVTEIAEEIFFSKRTVMRLLSEGNCILEKILSKN